MSIFTFIFPFNNSFSHIPQLDDYSTPPLYRERKSRGRGEEASERSRSVVTSMASKLLLITVFILDLIAFGLAVAAEQRRSTVSFYFLFLLYYCYSKVFPCFLNSLCIWRCVCVKCMFLWLIVDLVVHFQLFCGKYVCVCVCVFPGSSEYVCRWRY